MSLMLWRNYPSKMELNVQRKLSGSRRSSCKQGGSIYVSASHISCRYQDPFEDYKKRLAKKLAKRAESEQAGDKRAQKRDGDDINWFGIKVGADGKAGGPGGGVGGGVGKYLNTAKRPLGGGLSDIGGDDAKKKRKIGFGDFEGW